MSERVEDFPVEAQRAISQRLYERHCHEGVYGLPFLDDMPPLQVAYEAILALQEAGFRIEREDGEHC